MRRKGSDTRAEIQDVAMTLFTEHGYDATSMREIAEQLGITKAALYYHFDSKEQIIVSLLEAPLSALDELLDWAERQPRSPELSCEILTGWLALTAARGTRAMRFAVVNHNALRLARPSTRGGTLQRVERASRLILGPDASVQDLLRVRMALLGMHSAVLASHRTDADDNDVLAVATHAAELLVGDLLPTPKITSVQQWKPPA
jgi:AcrR family transcriptional regulator